jgi:hypothetical protein
MSLPPALAEISSTDDGFLANLHWRIAIERPMHAIVVIKNPDLFELLIQITVVI